MNPHVEVDTQHWDGVPFPGLDVRHWLTNETQPTPGTDFDSNVAVAQEKPRS